jgi:AcrR family transcriptional regulator
VRGRRPARAPQIEPQGSRSGSRGLGRSRIVEIQRARIFAAMAEVCSERGVESTTVAHVVGRAGVSRRTFYDLFDDIHDCFLAAFDDAVARASGRVLPAYNGQDRWVDGVRAGLFELLAFFDAEPQLARLCVVQALAGGPAVLARRREIMRALTAAVDRGAVDARARHVPPPLTGEGVVGAVCAVIHTRLLESDELKRDGLEGDRLKRGGPEDNRLERARAGRAGGVALTGLLGSLTAMIVLPYLGPAAARRELERPAPAVPKVAQDAENAVDHLEGFGMRLTYRTLRALAVIAARPGINNREVAEHAGIADPGQTSKLLSRLGRLGLIENTGEGHTKGATNAWTLTPRGAALQAPLDVAPTDDQLPQR